MNVVKEDIDAVGAVVRVSIEKADYAEAVEKSLKDYRKKATIHGFRPGMAPMGLVRKMYYRYVIVDEVSKMATNKLFDYIKEQNLHTLGEPMPTENQAEINWDTDENFEFAWEIGIAPEFEVKLSKRDKFPMYKINIDDEIRNRYIESYTNHFGSYKPADVADEKSLIRVSLVELDANEAPLDNGVSVAEAPISISLVADQDERKKLVGSKAGDVMVIDTLKAFPNQTDRAALLGVKKEELANLQPNFQITVASVETYTPAELNQELFDKAFGKDTVTTLDEFKARIESKIEEDLGKESDARFAHDARQKLVEKVKFDLPKAFLLRWLEATNEGKFSREELEKEYPAFEQDLRWSLITNRIAEEHSIKVEKEEVESFAKDYARAQFAAYGMNYLPEEYIDRYANEMLKKQDENRRLFERVLDIKVVDWIKDTVGINVKEVSNDEFYKR